MVFEGQQRSFRVGDETLLEKDVALKLFQEGVVLPGQQSGKTIQN
jgi:hypothetical protein